MAVAVSSDRVTSGALRDLPSPVASPDYHAAELQFINFLAIPDLDHWVRSQPEEATQFEATIAAAIQAAYPSGASLGTISEAHLFLQRILYRINRLNLFWYDDLQSYENERSFYLQQLRNVIESPWQAWELAQLDVAHLQKLDVQQALMERCEADLNPPITNNKRYLREEMSVEGYRHLLAIASLDGLVEASRLSRILGGASNEVQATLIRVLLEEYGNGRLPRKHSTFFAKMMAELSLDTSPEGYFHLAPWEVLATINHNFLLTECKRYFLRYNGGLTYFEIAGPTFYTDYLLAAKRLGLSDLAMGYWELHIREDERHGQWMLHEAALPLAKMYPQFAWELVLGYDQEKLMGDRAGDAVIQAVKQAEKGHG
ncbi:MAG: iron-containing redox enzyme family protein [Leptolyngbyaceae cyanobacterium bins.59]|nr:iron-containing redox enzyme family protein [Leptolyngbyaceae cyanobacterium bins.59]